jgi:CheY-like chemotaxis protein
LQRVIREDIDLVTRTEEGLGLVYADPGQLEQVLLNLVVNARDATVGAGRITIWTENIKLDPADRPIIAELPAGDYVVLTVQDTGAGIPPEIRDRLFEPFFTTKAAGKGTGLGLAMCYGIVTQAGGAITVESEPGAGARFHVLLPRTNDAEPEGAEAAKEYGAQIGRSERVLLVEDESQVRAIAARVLRQIGCTVVEAGSGEEALALLEGVDTRFDLVVTDMVMPRVGGRAVAERARQRVPGISVLLMSGYTEEIASVASSVGADTGFIAKPFTPADLREKVFELLAARHEAM